MKRRMTTQLAPAPDAAARALIDSYLRWWRDAGAVDAVSDAPFDWRAAPLPATPMRTPSAPLPPPAAAQPAAAPVTEAAPGDLDSFDAWLATAVVAGGHDGRRVPPAGPADAPLMVLSDVPEEADVDHGSLLSGDQGTLFDAMMRAIGLDRANIRLASLATTRPPAGRLDPRQSRELVDLAARHVTIARPRALLLLGQQACELVTGAPLGVDIAQRDFNHPGVKMAPFVIHHPRVLLSQPMLKRRAWDVLKTVRESIRS